MVSVLPKLVRILDEPIGDPAAINTLLICEAARDTGVKVVLSGIGADELFGGYRKHLACLMAERYRRLPGPVRSSANAVVNRIPVATAGRGSPLCPVGEALPNLRRAARGSSFPAQLQPLRPGPTGSTDQPRTGRGRERPLGRAP